MARETVKQILMRRDKMSEKEANELIAEFRAELAELLDENSTPIAGLCDAEQLVEDYFGLEPDYLDEFLF